MKKERLDMRRTEKMSILLNAKEKYLRDKIAERHGSNEAGAMRYCLLKVAREEGIEYPEGKKA